MDMLCRQLSGHPSEGHLPQVRQIGMSIIDTSTCAQRKDFVVSVEESGVKSNQTETLERSLSMKDSSQI